MFDCPCKICCMREIYFQMRVYYVVITDSTHLPDRCLVVGRFKSSELSNALILMFNSSFLVFWMKFPPREKFIFSLWTGNDISSFSRVTEWRPKCNFHKRWMWHHGQALRTAVIQPLLGGGSVNRTPSNDWKSSLVERRPRRSLDTVQVRLRRGLEWFGCNLYAVWTWFRRSLDATETRPRCGGARRFRGGVDAVEMRRWRRCLAVV